MFRQWTVGRKIAMGFVLVLGLLSVVGGVAYFGVARMTAQADHATEMGQLVENLAQKEIDHLNWAKQVSHLLTDATQQTLDVQTDPKQCAFGQWLYSEARRQAEADIPAIAPLLKELEQHHADLHASAAKIGAEFRQADPALGAFLREKKLDHLAWMHRVKDVFLSDTSTAFDNVQLDPHQCSLGRWLDAPETAALKREDPAFAAGVDAIIAPHQQLHRSVTEIPTLLQAGRRADACAHFVEQTAPYAAQTLAAIDGVLAWHDERVAGMAAANTTYIEQTQPALANVQRLLGEVSEQVQRVAHEAAEGSHDTGVMTQRTVAAVSFVAIVLGILSGVVITRGLISTLKRVIEGLSSGAEQVTEASAQIASSSQQLAEGASEQASSLEETSSALEQMSAMTRTNADNSQKVDTMATSAREAAGEGGRVVAQLNEAMEGISTASDQVGKIVKVIQEIAFQTNLLALNAAVEAARAGEHGKGFAVVAEEVRNLAMRSANAADEITELINNSSQQSRAGVQIAGSVNEALQGILTNITEMSTLISGIAQANGEQAEGVEQVNLAVSQMDKVTQQNAANAEESASASEELSAQAETVKTMVGELVAMVGGQARQAAAAPPAAQSSVAAAPRTSPAPTSAARTYESGGDDFDF